MGLVGAAGRGQGAGDLLVVQAGLAGGGGQGAQVGGRVAVQGAVGGPEQALVAVALGLAGDPAGQAAEVLAAGPGLVRRLGLTLGVQLAQDGVPVQGAAATECPDQLVGPAVDAGRAG